jgi:hypothetical protein
MLRQTPTICTSSRYPALIGPIPDENVEAVAVGLPYVDKVDAAVLFPEAVV